MIDFWWTTRLYWGNLYMFVRRKTDKEAATFFGVLALNPKALTSSIAFCCESERNDFEVFSTSGSFES